jgi:hypothetical protein
MRRRRLVPLLVLPAAVGALLATGSGASGQDPGSRTLTFTTAPRGSTFTHIRNTPGSPRRANTQGDVLAFRDLLLDASGARAGDLGASCITTRGARDFRKSVGVCTGIVALRDGTIALQAAMRPNAPVTGAVTGGTGAYANARGVFTAGETQTTITLAP